MSGASESIWLGGIAKIWGFALPLTFWGGGEFLCYNLQSNFHINDHKNTNTRTFSRPYGPWGIWPTWKINGCRGENPLVGKNKFISPEGEWKMMELTIYIYPCM